MIVDSASGRLWNYRLPDASWLRSFPSVHNELDVGPKLGTVVSFVVPHFKSECISVCLRSEQGLGVLILCVPFPILAAHLQIESDGSVDGARSFVDR